MSHVGPKPFLDSALVVAVLCAATAFGGAQDSRPESAPAVDDPADVARICELYEEARASVAEGDFESAAELTAEADAERARRLRCDHERLASALNELGLHLHAVGRVSAALSQFEASRAMRERLFKSDHPNVATSLNNVASCLQALGRAAEALPLLEAARAMRERLYTGDHPDVATSLNNVAKCLDALGREAEALPLCEAARAMWERLYPGDHRDVAASLSNLAGCLQDLGRAAEALPLYEAARAMRERLFKGDHPDVAQSLNNVASCLQALGRAAEALPLYEAARVMRQRLYPGDHPDVATSLNNVARCLQTLGRAGEALPLYEAARAMGERLFKGDHPDVAQSLNNVASCLQALGRAAEALPLYEAARAMRERLFKGDHPAVATSLNNVAGCLRSLGRFGEALPLYEAARAMQERLFNGDHPHVATGLNNVANCLRSLGRAAEALPLYEAAHAMWERLFKGDHPDVATSLNNVAFCLDSLGRFGEALPLYEAARAMRERLFKGDHPAVATSLNNVALCLMSLGRAAEALPLCEASRAMWERLFKGDHPDVARSLNNVALCLKSLGRAGEALPLYEAARAMRERLFKGDHPDVAASLNNVAACLKSLGRAGEALPLYEAALVIVRRRGYGDLGFVLGNSASAHVATGDLEGAASRWDEAAEVYEARRREVAWLAERERGAYEGVLRGRAIYSALSATRLRLGDVDGGFAALERGRGRAALDLIARARTEPLAEARRRAVGASDARRVAAIDSTAAEIAAAETEVARWTHAETAVFARKDLDGAGRSAELAKVGAAATAARTALHAAETERARLIADVLPLGRPATVGAARSLIAGKERLLAYAVGTEKSRVFVLRPAGEDVVVHELKWPEGGAVTASNLAEAVADYRAALTAEGRRAAARGVEEETAPASKPSTSSDALARRLFSAVMPQDLWPEIRDAGRVELMADGALHLLPFEALVVSEGATPAERRYWLDVGPQIVYAASASTSLEARRLRDARRTTPTPYAVLAVGDPRYFLEDRAASRATPPERGVLVVRVPDVSPGAAAGLRRGDVVTGYGASSVADAKQLAEAENAASLAAEDAPGSSTVEIAVWRADGPVRLVVPTGRLGVEVAKEPPPAAWAALARGDETAVAVVERSGVLGRRGALAPLPGTRREVESIARTVEGLHDPLRGKLSVKTLLGVDATVTRVFAEAPKARILHFATHYLAEETEEASFSALALTAPALPSRDDDGFLRIRDVIERWRDRLSATELVVLSACESKGSRGSNDDGIYAMPIALLYAGVPSVVASLWRVEDQSTADLMSDFYRRLFDPAANAATSDRPAPTRLEHFTAARRAPARPRPSRTSGPPSCGWAIRGENDDRRVIGTKRHVGAPPVRSPLRRIGRRRRTASRG